jgi:Protein of unknown function (DUF2934)
MRSVSIRSTKSGRKTSPLQQQSSELPKQEPQTSQGEISPEDMHILIEKRAYERYSERGYQDGWALDDWLAAERDILARVSPASAV